MDQPMQVVWFKRDLRVHDHRALAEAAMRGPVLPLYVIEPDLWKQPDMSGRQWAFITESLASLRADLAALGQPLILRQGSVPEVLAALHEAHGIDALWSHEETGNGWTYQRDKEVGAWCRDKGIAWHEIQNHGVIRRLGSRNGWAGQWDRFMAEPITQAPHLAPLSIDPGHITSGRDLGLQPDPCPDRQRGGRKAALACRDSFLFERGETYRKDMSSPLKGAATCSRLSPHLAWGTISMREAAQATWARQRALKEQPGRTGAWRPSMSSFTGRLHWHCHFMQKLEDEPRIEFQNLHPAYDGLRPAEPDAARLAAWERGETGLPFFDACMRSLRQTGWLNFRMRAMVMAVSSYHLWLDWRAPGLSLARMFTDYEPGIHWSQTQMQSGTTGINTVRVYNPVKQGKDQDPDGRFTRRWLPELADIPDAHLQEPWKAETADTVLGKHYPHPIVDYLDAAKEARQKVWAVRGGAEYRTAASGIQAKHGSRKSGIPNRGQRAKPKTDSAQMSFLFDGDNT